MNNVCRIYSSVKRATLHIVVESHRNAGHSKWANIKHTKALKDGQRAAQFTKLGRMMRVAIIEGKCKDPITNLKLATIITQAKTYSNMTDTAIQNIIKTSEASKELSKSAFLDFRGPGNCMIVADVLTVNLTKTRQLVLNILRKNNGTYADGTSKHLFDLKGVIEVNSKSSETTAEIATEHAIEAGAEDVKELGIVDGKHKFEFISDTESLNSIKQQLEGLGYEVLSASKHYIPHTLVTLSDVELEAVAQLCEKLEDNPDIVRLYDNIA